MAYPVMKDLQAKVNGFKRHYEKLIDSMPEVNLLLKQLEKNDQLLDVIERRVTQEANTIQPGNKSAWLWVFLCFSCCYYCCCFSYCCMPKFGK